MENTPKGDKIDWCLLALNGQFWWCNKGTLRCIICDFYCTSTQHRIARKHVRGEHIWTCHVNCYIEFWPDKPHNKCMSVYSSWENGMFTITSERSLIKMTNWLHCTLSGADITWISPACTQRLQCKYVNSSKMQKIGLMCV